VGKKRWVKVLKWLCVASVLSLILTGADVERRSRDNEFGLVATEDTLMASMDELDLNGLVVRAPTLVSQLTGAESPARTEEHWNIYGATSASASSSTARFVSSSAIPGAARTARARTSAATRWPSSNPTRSMVTSSPT
jgi:hypothetical protein